MLALTIVFLSMSLFTAILYCIDKHKANLGKERIPEIVLIACISLGGLLGAVITMIAKNHKSNMSRKWHFFFVLIAAFAAQALIWGLAIAKYY